MHTCTYKCPNFYLEINGHYSCETPMDNIPLTANEFGIALNKIENIIKISIAVKLNKLVCKKWQLPHVVLKYLTKNAISWTYSEIFLWLSITKCAYLMYISQGWCLFIQQYEYCFFLINTKNKILFSLFNFQKLRE